MRSELLFTALLMSALLTSSLASAQGEPAADDPTQAAAEAIAEAAAPAEPEGLVKPLRVDVEEGFVLVRDARDADLWRMRLLTLDRVGDWRLLHATVGDSVFVCARRHLYELNLEDGHVQARNLLPGRCDSVTAGAEGAVVEVSGGREPYQWEMTLTFAPGQLRPTLSMGDDIHGVLLTRHLAEAELERHLANRLDAEQPLSPEEREAIARAAARLGVIAERDPTNPWYRLERADYLDALGRADEAREVRRSLLDIPEDYHHELMPMAQQLDEFDLELGARAFDLALRDLRRKGFEPELNHGLIPVALKLGRLMSPRTPEKIARRAERIAAFAPRAEGSTWFHAAMATKARARGDEDAARRFEQLRDEAYPYRVLGGASEAAWISGEMLNIYIACAAAFWILLLIKVARTVMNRLPEGAAKFDRYNPLARMTRGELAGFILLFAGGMWSARRVAMGVVIIGHMASMPMPMANGDLANPTSQRYLEQAPDSDATTFMRALSAHKAGDLDRASKLYAQLGEDARALNNLGVLRATKGNEAAARDLWERARALDPQLAEARHNLGEEVPGSTRVERAVTQGVTAPLLALPTLELWEEFWQAMAHQNEELSPLNALGLIWSVGDLHSEISRPQFAPLSMGLLTMLMMALVLVSLARWQPTAEYDDRGVFGWAVGSLVPGASRHYGPLGAPVLAAFIVSVVVSLSLIETDGAATNILDSIATFSGLGFYGDQEFFAQDHQATARTLASLWWVFILGNLAFVALMEHLRPDPNGLVARMREEQ